MDTSTPHVPEPGTLDRPVFFQKRESFRQKSLDKSPAPEPLGRVSEELPASPVAAPLVPQPGRVNLWWRMLVLCVLFPAWMAKQAGYARAITSVQVTTRMCLDFDASHQVHIPEPGDEPRDYARTDADLVRWHTDMSALYSHIMERQPVKGVEDQMLDFEFEEFQGSRGIVSEFRAASVLIYCLLCGALYFVDSVHLGIVLLAFNGLLFYLALQIKVLNDAMSTAEEALGGVQLGLALLPMEGGAGPALSQHLLLLQKLDLLLTNWQGLSLGLVIRFPFRADTMTMNLSLVMSLAAAASVRCAEVIIGGFYPGLPRFVIIHKVYQWVMRPQQPQAAPGQLPPASPANHKQQQQQQS